MFGKDEERNQTSKSLDKKCQIPGSGLWKYTKPSVKTGQLASCIKSSPDVLVCAGMKFISITAAHIALCFGSVTKTVLVTHRCSSYCWAVLAQHQGLFCFSNCPASKQADRTQPEEWHGHKSPELACQPSYIPILYSPQVLANGSDLPS